MVAQMAIGDDVVTLLVQQHREVESELDALLGTDDAAERATRLARVGDLLAVHISAEEQVFYPAVHAARTEDILLESLEEHLSLKRLLADLLRLAPTDTTFGAKCKVLEEQTRHHHHEEEDHLFPKTARLLDDIERSRLGSALQQHEMALRARGAPRYVVTGETDEAAPLE